MTCAICLLQPTRLCRSRRTLSAVPLFSQLRPFKVLCRRLPKRLQDVLALRRVLFFGERASELCDPNAAKLRMNKLINDKIISEATNPDFRIFMDGSYRYVI
jgi:hypothetical protein